MADNEKQHPAYQEILDALPDSLHPAIIPVLKKWDAGVTQKFQEIHASYEDLKPFKQFVENNIAPDYVEQAIILADELQRDPHKVVNRINESWELGYLNPEQAKELTQAQQQSNPPSGDEGEDLFGNLNNDDDIMSNPKVKAMMESLTQIQQEFDSRKQAEEQEAEISEFEEYLDTLEAKVAESNLPFNRLFVTALIHQGVDGEEAVKQYHEVIAQAAGSTQNTEQATNNSSGTDQPPVVMGGEGTAGSGSPDGSVNFGSLRKNDLNATVEQMLAQAAESGQG